MYVLDLNAGLHNLFPHNSEMLLLYRYIHMCCTVCIQYAAGCVNVISQLQICGERDLGFNLALVLAVNLL